MIFKNMFFAFLILFPLKAIGSENITKGLWSIPENIYWNLPPTFYTFFSTNKIKEKYSVNSRVNPVYLRGDFDGNGIQDYAIFIRNLEKNKDGILICSVNSDCEILFAGNSMKEMGGRVSMNDDLKRINFWKIDTRELIEKHKELTQPIVLKGDGIKIGRIEAFSKILYWDGSEYVTHQLSD